MIPDALAKQAPLAPLFATAAALLARPGAVPQPVVNAALQLLAQRVTVQPGGKPSAAAIASALVRSGVPLEGLLARGEAAPANLKSTLLALRGALGAWLGSDATPVTAIRPAPPPMRGMPPRAALPDQPPMPELPRDVARLAHQQADGAIARLKLMQLASLPDADPARPQSPELRFEIPFAYGHQLAVAQFQIARDGRSTGEDRRRGWTLRFAMHLAGAGEVGAEIGLLGRSVNVALWASEPALAADLEAMLPELAPALAGLGLEPGAIRIRHGAPDAPPVGVGTLLDSRR